MFDSLTRNGQMPLAWVSCAGSRFRGTNREFVQSNECEGAREDREDAVTDLDFAALTPGLVPEAEPVPAPCITTVGTSQIAKMRVALGLREWVIGDPDYIRRHTAKMKRGSGQSRALLVAAGILAPLRDDDDTLSRGWQREPEIFAAWKSLLEGGWFSTPFEEQIDPATITWRPPARPGDPRIIDRDCPELDTGGFDGDALTWSGDVVTIDAKCARYKHPKQRFAGPVWWERGACPWWYEDQLQAIMSIRRVRHSLLIVGGGWNRDDDDQRGDGPIRVFYVPRIEPRIDEVRAIATNAVRVARELRATAAKAA